MGLHMSFSAVSLHKESVYFGMCDASAAVAVGRDLFAVGDDESNDLKLYSLSRAGAPVGKIPLATFLPLEKKKDETDIEGVADFGDVVYWITSHGRNKNGKERTSRQFFFATKRSDDSLIPTGQPYRGLLDDFASAPELAQYRLGPASQKAPKDPGALNIEALCPGPNGSVWIGFRNPLIRGKALLVPLLNPGELTGGTKARAKFGAAVELDLGGKGLRAMTVHQDQFYLVGGHYDSGGSSELYRWDGKSTQAEKLYEWGADQWNAEAIFFAPAEGGDLLVLSDDGSRQMKGVECKELPEAQRQFRGVVVRLK